MGLLAVQREGATLTAHAQAFVVRHGHHTLSTQPVHEVDEIQLYGAIELTAAARTAALRAGVEILLLTPKGRVLGRLSPPAPATARRRLAQYRALADPTFALALARDVVRGKLVNQRALLQRLARERADAALTAAVVALGRLVARIDQPADLDALRGAEGQAAALHYRALAKAVAHPDMAFERRSRRPPRDPFNACLSFGYVLLGNRVESALRRAGLDPALGALHPPDDRRPSLALDVLEPFRPLVDRLVLRLVNRRQLQPADFVHPDIDPADATDPRGGPELGPATHLGPNGRAVFLRAYGALLRTRFDHPDQDARHTLLDLLDAHAHALVRRLEGTDDTYTPFVLR